MVYSSALAGAASEAVRHKANTGKIKAFFILHPRFLLILCGA